ncbi:hypothetical protein Glove_109g243 [Diversispora epigaea]|uniref:Uncharacterized protein n=1 Tax=Diversispora epigaea TaxID=1348612 RepID=A0A397JBY9_9GLOM|nr:hypothetical protein Glove_109g243 [Diversispora epigaea]
MNNTEILHKKDNLSMTSLTFIWSIVRNTIKYVPITYACTHIVALVLLFLFSVTAKKTRTITRTRNYTKTVYPANCPARETTKTSTTTYFTTTTSTFTSITSTTTFTTTTSLPQIDKKRSNKVICNIDKNGCYFPNKYTKIVFCKPTVFLPCPKACKKTATTIKTSTSIITSTATTKTTAVLTSIILETCLTPYAPCFTELPDSQCCVGTCRGNPKVCNPNTGD